MNRSVKHAGKNLIVPAGYGLAPYMYLGWLINLAFEYCGFEVVENVFRTDPILRDLVVLHRYADLLVPSSGSFTTTGWRVSGEHMVPNITMGELITFIHDKFGAFATVRGKKVSIRLYRDIVQETYDLDLSNAVVGEVSLSYPEPASLTMTQDDGIESGSPAAESMEDLRAGYPSLANALTYEDISGSGLFYVDALGKYYHKRDNSADPVLIGAQNLAFKRTLDGITAEEELNPGDIYVPMVYVKSAALYMPYVGDAAHVTVEVEEKEDTSSPIMLCFAHYYQDSDQSNEIHCQGQTTVFHYQMMNQNRIGTTTTPEGVVSAFWNERWKQLADGAPELSCQLRLSMEQLESMDLFTVKRLNGCLVLMKSFKYSMGAGGGISPIDAIFQLLTNYADGLQIPPVSFSSRIKWKLVSTRKTFDFGNTNNGVVITATDGLTDYDPANDQPDYTPVRVGVKAKHRKRWLTYRQYITKRWENIFTPYSHSEWDGKENYDEYFVSYLEE